MKKIKKNYLLSILWLLPSVILLAIFVYGFIINTFYISFTDWGRGEGLKENPVINIIGLNNFEDLFQQILNIRFRQDLVNAVFYSLFLVAGALLAGLGLAILLDRNVRGENFFRTLFLYPMALSFVVSGTIWRWLLAPNGGLNRLPELIGLKKIDFQWISSRDTWLGFDWADLPAILCSIALIIFLIFLLSAARKKNRTRISVFSVLSTLCIVYLFFIHSMIKPEQAFQEIHGFKPATLGIILAGIWQYSGYTMALYLAGLRSLPVSIYEASMMDGANIFTYYFKIAIPNLWPITLSAVIILSHISLKLFALIFSMAGPDNTATGHPSILMYLSTFRGNNFAIGAAISVILFLFSAVFIIPHLLHTFRERRTK